MELFSEIYGCYYSILADILKATKNGIHKSEFKNIISEKSFYETEFHLLPKIFSNEWNFLKTINGTYYSKLENQVLKRPMTAIEKSWLKTIVNDKRIKLFLEEKELDFLNKGLKDSKILFREDDFVVTNISNDGDDYSDINYKCNFKKILLALKLQRILHLSYENSKTPEQLLRVVPYKITYSSRDDKFRLVVILLKKNIFHKKMTLNLSRIKNILITDDIEYNKKEVELFLKNTENKNEYIVVELYKHRNTIERFMLQFATWEKETTYEESGFYTCKIFYELSEELELLIKILSFTPTVKVIAPESFLEKIRERVKKQLNMEEFKEGSSKILN